MHFIIKIFTFWVLIFCLITQAHASLTTIGHAQYEGQNYNLIWENDGPFGSAIWLDYTSDSSTWANQVVWASTLNAIGALSIVINPGYTVTWNGEWRLPMTVDSLYTFGYDGSTSGGYNITTSEMGHLFYIGLGNKGMYDASGDYVGDGNYGVINNGPFSNLRSFIYWSETEYDHFPATAWNFNFNSGLQDPNVGGKDDSSVHALALRFSVVSIPEPIMLLLFGSSIVGLVALKKMLG